MIRSNLVFYPGCARDTGTLNDQLFELLSASVPDQAICMLDEYGLISIWNAGAEQFYQYTSAEAIGQPVSLICISGLEIPLQQAFINDNFQATCEMVRKDGSRFPADVTYRPLYQHSELCGYAMITRNLFYKKNSDAKLAEHPEKVAFHQSSLFRQLIEHSYSGISLFDADFNFIYRSPSASRITGFSNSARANVSINEMVHPSDQVRIKQFLRELLRQPGSSRTCYFRSRHFDGHFIHLECVFSNLLHVQDIAALVLNFRDISKEQEAKCQLEQTLGELSAYRHALDVSAIVAITDRQGIIRHVNDNFCHISGYTREELIGQNHTLINTPMHDPAFIENIRRTLDSGQVWRGDFCNLTKAGKEYWVDKTIVPFMDEQGKPYQFISIHFDITERKMAKEKLQQQAADLEASRQNYSDLFQLSPLPKFVFNSDTLEFLDVNQAAVNHYGYNREEFLAMTILDIRPEEEIPLVETAIENARKNAYYFRPGTFTHRKKSGELISVEITSSAISYAGRPARIVLVTDVTECIRQLEAIEIQNKKLREISWMQSHIIRAPLSRILGLVNIFDTTRPDQSEIGEILEYIRLSADELDSVIRAIINSAGNVNVRCDD